MSQRGCHWFCDYSLLPTLYIPIARTLLFAVAAAVKSLQSCPTSVGQSCDPTDGSPLGSPVPGILQARTLECVAISFSNAWKWKVKVKSLSCVWLSATPWTAAYQAPPSMGFSRQDYLSGLPLPSLAIALSGPKTCHTMAAAWISHPCYPIAVEWPWIQPSVSLSFNHFENEDSNDHDYFMRQLWNLSEIQFN